MKNENGRKQRNIVSATKALQIVNKAVNIKFILQSQTICYEGINSLNFLITSCTYTHIII
jgi:hypothetical protein